MQRTTRLRDARSAYAKQEESEIMSEKTKLYSAIVKAQQAAKALFKDAKNEHHGYKYVSAEQLIQEGRRALGSVGLALYQIGATLHPQTPRLNVGKSQELVGRIVVTYRLIHESGESEDVYTSLAVVVSGGRPDDKAESAAYTMALGYFLRSLLLIPRDDEVASIDQRDDRSFDPETKQVAPDDAAAIALVNRAWAQSGPEAVVTEAARTLSPEHVHADTEKYTWSAILADWKRRVTEARKASTVAEVIAEARAVKLLPKQILAEIETFARDADARKQAKGATV